MSEVYMPLARVSMSADLSIANNPYASRIEILRLGKRKVRNKRTENSMYALAFLSYRLSLLGSVCDC